VGQAVQKAPESTSKEVKTKQKPERNSVKIVDSIPIEQ
jgi:hypothetical protein